MAGLLNFFMELYKQFFLWTHYLLHNCNENANRILPFAFCLEECTLQLYFLCLMSYDAIITLFGCQNLHKSANIFVIDFPMTRTETCQSMSETGILILEVTLPIRKMYRTDNCVNEHIQNFF